MLVNGHRPRDERFATFCPVECGRCGAAVLAAKFSPQHTSVQWTAAAVRACAEFGVLASLEGRPSALVAGCGSLRDSIDAPLAATFGYLPGQFVTVRVPSDLTGSVARCYSLSSSPHAGDRPAITVKRTAGGYASNWIFDQVTAGSVLDLLPPAGTFSPRSLDGDFLLFAAGSGITPVMSILKSALCAGRGRVVLVYANRDERSVIFGGSLRGLVSEFPGRL